MRAPLVVYADGPDGPLPDPSQVAAIAALVDPQIQLGWVLRRPEWLDSYQGPVRTWMAGYGLRDGVAGGRVAAVPTRLSTVPGLLQGRSRPAVAVVGARRAGSGFRLVGGVGWAPVAAATADAVVVELWDDSLWDDRWGIDSRGIDSRGIDGAAVPGRIVEVIARSAPPDPRPRYDHDDTEQRIGELAASLIPAGSTLQWGPGALCAAVIDALAVPVRVLSGLVTDELVGLRDRGLLIGRAEAAYAWGGPGLAAMAAAGEVFLAPVTATHDPSRLAATRAMVACNTALQVGLDGSVNVESAGGRLVAGPGGHSDFAEGASRAVDGRSIIAVRASHRGRSCIVARPETVTTSRSDVTHVVTEYGIADLRDADLQQRARRLVAIAAPEHRPALASG